MKSRKSAGESEEIIGPARQFDEIAFLYDELMAAVPYDSWVEYVQCILSKFDYHPRTILDLCCGTGGAGLLLAETGYQVSGVDISSCMVDIAKRKAAGKGLSVDYCVQDVSSLRLRRRFDLILSLFDSLNYILESSVLQQTFHRISEHLQPGGLLIFDMNTELAFTAGLFDQNNLGSKASVVYDWHSSYDPTARICRIRMEFAHKRHGVERCTEVVHYQRAYDEREIVGMLECAGLQVLAVYDAYTLRQASSRSDRIFFVARK